MIGNGFSITTRHTSTHASLPGLVDTREYCSTAYCKSCVKYIPCPKNPGSVRARAANPPLRIERATSSFGRAWKTW